MTEFSTGEGWSAERGSPQGGPVHPQAGDNTPDDDVSRETNFRVRTAEDIAVAAPDFDHDPGTPLAQAPKHWAQAGWVVRECSNMEVHPLVGWAPSDDSSVGG